MLISKLRLGIKYIPSFCLSLALFLPLWAEGSLPFAKALIGAVLTSCALCSLEFSFLHKDEQHGRVNSKLVSIAFFLILEAAFLASLFANYPGLYSVDSIDIVNQALGQSHYSLWYRYEGLSNHHPVLYTMFVKFFLTVFGYSASSFAILSFTQSILVAASISYAALWVYEKTGRLTFTFSLVVFFAINPIVQCYAITLWKDVLFGCVFLAYTIHFLRYREGGRTRNRELLLFVFGLLLSLLRSNGFVVVIASLLIVLLDKCKEDARIALAGSIAAWLLITNLIYPLAGISSAHFSEAIAMPLQQIGATAASGGYIPDSAKTVIEKVLPLEEFAASYSSGSPNPIKFSEHFNDEYLESHKMEFLLAWFQVLPYNIKTYVIAWLNETAGYWMPEISGYTIASGGDMPAGIMPNSFGWAQTAEESAHIVQKYPIAFSLGNIVWFYIALLFVNARHNNRLIAYRKACDLIPAGALYLTLLIAAPVMYDFRYLFSLYLCAPFFFVYVTASNNNAIEGNREITSSSDKESDFALSSNNNLKGDVE